jgi:hypothetical protein
VFCRRTVTDCASGDAVVPEGLLARDAEPLRSGTSRDDNAVCADLDRPAAAGLSRALGTIEDDAVHADQNRPRNACRSGVQVSGLGHGCRRWCPHPLSKKKGDTKSW